MGGRVVAFFVLSYLVAVSGSLRPLVNSINVPFTDFITSLGLGEMRDYSERLDNNLILLYFLFSAIVAVLLIAIVEWSIRRIRKR
ncbi:ABC transporter permease [Kosakonia sp. BK9b]